MNDRSRIWSRLGFLVLVLTTPSCCTDPVNGKPYFCFGDVSYHQEAQIGASYAPSFIAQSGGKYPDPELQKYLEKIVVEKMARKSHRPDLQWEFMVLNTSQINAFALPGGRVFVTRGLLAKLDSEAQFAHLMGHELGHVCHRHALRGQGRNALMGILVGTIGVAEREARILLGDPDDPLVVTGTVGTMGALAFLQFSRDQELESDQRGVDYAVDAGYDPREGTKTFEMFLAMKEAAGRSENLVAGLLSTHPLDTTRIKDIDKYIERTYPAIASGEETLEISSPEWASHMDRLRAAQLQYDKYDEALDLLRRSASDSDVAFLERAKSLLEEAIAALPGQAPFHVGLALVEESRKDRPAVRKHLDRAIELDDSLFEARFFRGVLFLEEGDPKGSQKDLLAAYDIYPASPFPCFQLGESTAALKRWDAAVDWYQRALRRSPKGTEVRGRARENLKKAKKELKIQAKNKPANDE